MKCYNIKFNTVGKVIKGECPDWYILIVDRRFNKDSRIQTGGIYIFQSNYIDFWQKSDSLVYDDWVEDLEALRIFFSEPEWLIEWLEVEPPSLFE